MSRQKQIEERTEQLVTPIAEANGVRIYDVEYVKSGGEYGLTVFIDKEGGVNIQDCEAVSRALSDALDEDDFIGDPYTLYVSSPGLGRKLTRDRHLAQSIGMRVEVRLYKADPQTGSKDLAGVLLGYDSETIRILADTEGDPEERTLARKAVAVIRLELDL